MIKQPPVVLFRLDPDNEDELLIAQKYFPISTYRNAVPKNSLVIGRYSVLPYYDELEKDLAVNGSQLINTYKQHNWIKYNYYFAHELEGITPDTWDHLSQTDYQGPFVVKGRVNSRKHQWNTHMFAKDRAQAALIASTLMNDDPLIQQQGVIYRKYVPLVTYEVGINGQPFTDEWRFFFLGKELISYGYYWSIALKVDYTVDPAMVAFAKNVAAIVAQRANFFVLDVARTEEGNFILIEINDGQMSGLSMNDPETLYKNLAKLCSSNGLGH